MIATQHEPRRAGRKPRRDTDPVKAATAYGRFTNDIDICYDTDPGNLHRLARLEALLALRRKQRRRGNSPDA